MVMAKVICLKFKKETGTFSSRFHFDELDEFFVQTVISSSYHYNIITTLEWKKLSNLFIRAKIYCSGSSAVFKKSLIVKNNKCALISAVTNDLSHSNILVIKIAHWKHLQTSDNILSAECRDSIDVSIPLHRIKEPVICEKTVHLSSDFRNLLGSGYLSDIVLTDGTNEIRAHKLILSARSPVFNKMLQHEMRETLESVIVINDIPIDVLKALLYFMYTGEVEIKDLKMAASLYVAGDKYDVKGLKDICSEILMKVDLDNILQVIILADLYSDEPLKQAAFDFIHDNYQEVKALDSWGDFLRQNQTLAIEVLSSELDRRH